MKKLTILIIILLIFGFMGYALYREGTLAVDKTSDSSIIFVVDPGEKLDSIINNLSKADLIRNRVVFKLIVKQLGIEREIQAGDFRLSQNMNAYEVADALTHGSIDLWVTVPEGLRKEEIGEIMEKTFDVPAREFASHAKEGYLFPDTYLIPKNPSAETIISIMRTNFDTKYTDELRAKARKLDLSDTEVLILASIVEREAKFDEDRVKVASVLLRRYREDYPLQVDATVQYALGYQPDEDRWWKSTTTFKDLENTSPYNTYKKTGLPPTPISNPGLASLEAIVNADPETPYMFYVSEPSGRTHFSETYEEHQAYIEKYLR